MEIEGTELQDGVEAWDDPTRIQDKSEDLGEGRSKTRKTQGSEREPLLMMRPESGRS